MRAKVYYQNSWRDYEAAYDGDHFEDLDDARAAAKISGFGLVVWRGHTHFVDSGNIVEFSMPLLPRIVRTVDGDLYIDNGHHHLTAMWLLGRGENCS